MTLGEAASIMIGGGDSPLSLPDYIVYMASQTSVQDIEIKDGEYIYGEQRTVNKDSIVTQRIFYNENGEAYKLTYEIYELIIEDIDTQNEEVVGIIDRQTDTEYRFQFNARGGR